MKVNEADFHLCICLVFNAHSAGETDYFPCVFMLSQGSLASRRSPQGPTPSFSAIEISLVDRGGAVRPIM
jgi:hypothetical protein